MNRNQTRPPMERYGGRSGRPPGRVAAAALICLALIAALGACVVQPAYGPYGGAYATVAPPAVQVEVQGIAPAPGYFWVAGYWGWFGNRHEWVPGRWEAPRQGYRYEPHRWEREGEGWRLHPGRWVEERRER